MTLELLTAIVAFAFVSSITPGPNNLMLLASGVNYGFKRSIPHMLGIAVGFVVMMAMVGISLMQIFDAYPLTHTLLKVFSIVYLLFLSYKIATASAPSGTASKEGKPLTFIQAALFQWVNPKAWTMAMMAISMYSPSRSVQSVLILSCIFGLVNLPSISFWTVLGQQLRTFLSDPVKLRAFNYTMAILLVATLYPVLAPGMGS